MLQSLQSERLPPDSSRTGRPARCVAAGPESLPQASRDFRPAFPRGPFAGHRLSFKNPGPTSSARSTLLSSPLSPQHTPPPIPPLALVWPVTREQDRGLRLTPHPRPTYQQESTWLPRKVLVSSGRSAFRTRLFKAWRKHRCNSSSICSARTRPGAPVCPGGPRRQGTPPAPAPPSRSAPGGTGSPGP